MAGTTENQKILDRFIESMSNLDADRLSAVTDEGLVFTIMGSGAAAGVKSKGDMLGAYGAMKRVFPAGVQARVQETLGSGNRIVCRVECRAQTFDGVPYINNLCLFLTIEGGKITQAVEYADIQAVADVVGPAMERLGG